MESSVFLAKLIGPVMLAFGVFVTIYPARIARVGREVLDSDALMLISGAITLPAGLAVVLTHNLWMAGWPVAITLIGWIMVFAGLARLLLPGLLRRVGATMLDKPLLITLPGILMAAVGLYLSWQGYFGAVQPAGQ